MATTARWPVLDYDEWRDTIDTLHMWTQIVGKIRLALTPWMNHSWHVPLYVTPRGLTTSTMYSGAEPLDIELDFHRHELVLRGAGGEPRTIALRPRTVASFHEELFRSLDEMGFRIEIDDLPSEVPEPVRFSEDTVHASYDSAAVERFAQVLNESARVLSVFRAGFRGKSSPIHFFWGSFDLAVTRFSGRVAPRHPGGVPGLADWITREAYSHEVYSCGFWPGSAVHPAAAFYAYAYPTPAGLEDVRPSPADAVWRADLGEFVLPYDSVRGAPDPDGALLSFLGTTYEAVADLADWDRGALEVPEGYPRIS